MIDERQLIINDFVRSENDYRFPSAESINISTGRRPFNAQLSDDISYSNIIHNKKRMLEKEGRAQHCSTMDNRRWLYRIGDDVVDSAKNFEAEKLLGDSS